MKGVVFNLLEAFVSENWGEQQWEDIYQAALPKLSSVDPFVGPLTYPDTDMLALVESSVAALDVKPEKMMRSFGAFSFPHLAELAPSFVEAYTHPKPFLMTVHDVIHVEVRKMYDETVLPSFHFTDEAPDALVMRYRSPRKLFDFADGLIAGVAKHFGCAISVEKKYVSDDDMACDFHLQFQTPWQPK